MAAKKVQKAKTSKVVAKTKASTTSKWPVQAIDPPKLSDVEWGVSSLLGLIFLVMALLQLASFSDFKDQLNVMGFSGPSAWAVFIILAELWGAVGFFKLRLSYGFRLVSHALAVAVAGFWFINTLQLVAGGTHVNSNGLFGRFLTQQPGWWTVVEVTVLLFWTVHKVGLLQDKAVVAKR
jgi:hypothetical protein